MVPADEEATRSLGDLTPWLGRSGRVVTSPARRCLQPGGEVEPLLRPWDLGTWTRRPLADLDLTTWRSDPTYEGHGGESLLALLERVRLLLELWHDHQEGRLVAVTHGAVIKAAVVVVLGAPPAAIWDIDVHPGSGTELHARPGGWRTVRVNAPVAP